MKKLFPLLLLCLPLAAGAQTPGPDRQIPDLTAMATKEPVWAGVYDKIIPAEFNAGQGEYVARDYFWLQYVGTENNIDLKEYNDMMSKDHIDLDGQGFALGWQRYFKEGRYLGGVSFDYRARKYNSSLDIESDSKIKDYKLGLYGGYFGEKYQFKGIFSAGLQKYNLKDLFILPDVREGTETDGMTFEFDAEAARRIKINSYFNISPFLGGGVSYAKIDGYDVEPFGSMQGEGDSTDVFQGYTRLGLRLDGFVQKRLYWYAHAYWRMLYFGRDAKHDNSATMGGISVQDNSFKGDKVDVSSIGLGAGVNWQFYRGMGLHASYNMEKANNHDNKYFTLGLNYRFVKPLFAAAEPAPPAPVQPAKPRTLGQINNTEFEFDKYEIAPSYDVYLKQVAGEIIEYGKPVVIEGHADIRGTAEYNQALSERRAKAVYDRLISLGVPESQLSYEGFGYTQLLSHGTTPEDHALNRRVEIKTAQVV